MPVRLTRIAESELTDAIVWYETQEPGLGGGFLSEFRELTIRLAANPRKYPRVHKGSRRAPFHRVPYGLFFPDYRQHGRSFRLLSFQSRSGRVAAAKLSDLPDINKVRQ